MAGHKRENGTYLLDIVDELKTSAIKSYYILGTHKNVLVSDVK